MSDHPYAECVKSEHPCMKHKLRYWREVGQVGLAPIQEGWSDMSAFSAAAETIAHAKANNIELKCMARKELI